MDRKVFRSSIIEKKAPQWPCPTCKKSILEIVPATFHSEEAAESIEAHSHDAWEPEWVRYRFSCILKCSNGSCKEVVACVGRGGVEENYGYNYEGAPTQELMHWYTPLFFHPNLVMMDLPGDAPEEVTNELNSSFASFFADPNAAGNSVRAAIEALVTQLGVKRYASSAGPRKPIMLHQRIEQSWLGEFEQGDKWLNCTL